MSAAIKRAKDELARIGFGDQDTSVMLDLLRQFFAQWNDGGSASVAAPAILQRLIAGKCLSALTGEDSEWTEIDGGLWQNNRCSTVFKDTRNGGSRAYDLDNPLGQRASISFPYMPPDGQ